MWRSIEKTGSEANARTETVTLPNKLSKNPEANRLPDKITKADMRNKKLSKNLEANRLPDKITKADMRNKKLSKNPEANRLPDKITKADMRNKKLSKNPEANRLPDKLKKMEQDTAIEFKRSGGMDTNLQAKGQAALHNPNRIAGGVSENKLPEKSENANSEANVEKPDSIAEKIAKTIGTPEGFKELMEKHPEKAQLWKSQLEAIETLNDSEASPAEIRSAQAKLSILKGQIMEVAVKDTLVEAGFDVEAQQRVVQGESGGTRPDVIAVNNTDQPIEVFGTTIHPSKTLSIECKCGGSAYMTNQLNDHIPNQLSGQEGTKALLTTSDIKGIPDGLAESVCNKYGAKLITLDLSVSAVEKAIKEVAGK